MSLLDPLFLPLKLLILPKFQPCPGANEFGGYLFSPVLSRFFFPKAFFFPTGDDARVEEGE